MLNQVSRISKGLQGRTGETGAAHGARRRPALKEFASHLVRMSDGPRAALDLELAEGSQYQRVSRALTGFREEGGTGGWKMTHQYAQSCRLAPGWQHVCPGGHSCS